MSGLRLLQAALSSLEKNKEQALAANCTKHCVVLAGPGSGKTKTLTTAMARTIQQDVRQPRGVACITFNNECAYELEERLSRLGVEKSERIFIGTVHSFALTQIILPYGRCVLPEWSRDIGVASKEEINAAIAQAYADTINGNDNPTERWKFATEKRKRDIDRSHPEWLGRNEELARFVNSYEALLRQRSKIDFDDMPLIAYEMVARHEWIRASLRAKFPVLFVDEYQDLGHALHALVLKLCFESGIRLFAVGDIDQSLYAFNGAEPALLDDIAARQDVETYKLRFNYRCGTRIINASMAALGEERGYVGPADAHEGEIHFHPVQGYSKQQAAYVIDTLIPKLQGQGVALNEIGILYRWAKHSADLVAYAEAKAVPFVRADNQALVKRSSSVSRFIEKCARWTVGGWITATPRFYHLRREAIALVYGGSATEAQIRQMELELIRFLQPVDRHISTHNWLTLFRANVLLAWRQRATTINEQWDDLDEMIDRTDPSGKGSDLTLAAFSGDATGTGALNLSTFHSSKGREFRSVILLGMDSDVIPGRYSFRDPKRMREDRREFYVAVTRAKEQLHVVYRSNGHSQFVAELYQRSAQ
ncbi:MAG: ATP-dependent helicase [Hyphomicrobiaceae bacterium]|nr:ATP-dependent helicase [Hyphomicrobiaceae bacterium]